MILCCETIVASGAEGHDTDVDVASEQGLLALL